MRRLPIVLLMMGLVLSIPHVTSACPSCQAAIESTTGSNNQNAESENDDLLREARAYNYSIYLMVSMPYVLLGTFGFLIYRGVKKNQEWKRQLEEDPQ